MPEPTWSTAIAVVLTVLVPVGVFLAPLPIWMARRRGESAGITLTDPEALRRAGSIDTVLLDRWGTVTTGALRVCSLDPVDADHERNLRWFAGALEHAATDPVGRAIARLSGRGRVSRVEYHPGVGIQGSVDRHPVRVGKPAWVGLPERHGIGVTVGVEVDQRPIGYVTVTDDPRPHAADTVAALIRHRYTPVLVSDDNAANTEHLAQHCGIEDWHAETAPEKRERLVTVLQERGHRVAFAARHHDNAEALATADLAISDDADSPVPVVLTDLDVDRVRKALTLTRALARVGAALRWGSVAVAMVGALLAVLEVLTPLLAVGYALASAAVAVVLLRRIRF